MRRPRKGAINEMQNVLWVYISVPRKKSPRYDRSCCAVGYLCV